MSTGYGVIWDMDGVLVDTGDYHFKSWVKALAEVGLSMDESFFQETFGMNNTRIISILMGGDPDPKFIEQLGERKEIWFRELIKGHVEPLPGVRTWLERLQAENHEGNGGESRLVRSAIASSGPPANIEALIGGLGLKGYFYAIVSGAKMPAKPDPAVFLEAARQIEMPVDQCVVVEDAVAGVEGAKRAGMKCIAVTTTNPAAVLKDADIIVDRLDPLPEDAFRQLLKQVN
jgi:beta-phosphoglucomutase-like phosphatase (HAD superfamily)